MTARRLATGACAGAALLLTLVVAVRWGGGITGRIAGLPDPGAWTTWGLPVTRAAVNVGAVLTVGWCVTAAFLLPGTDPGTGGGGRHGQGQLLGPAGYRLLRRASWWAAGWAVASLAMLPLTLSELIGQPVSTVTFGAVRSLAWSVAQGQSALVQAVLAAVVAVACRIVLTRGGAGVVAVLACVAALPPALTGHAAGAGNHQLAVTSLAAHILGAALWVGGLAALLTLRSDRVLGVAAHAYSRLALACWAVVAVSGVANAAVRLGGVDELWQSRYGLLVLGKALALTAVGVAGAVHRFRTLPVLRAGAPGAFRRLAVGEVLAFAATLGLAVALARTPTPVPTEPAVTDPVTDLLGFPAPAPLSAVRVFWPPLVDAYFLAAVVIGTAAYLAGVRRLRRAGHPWPVSRTASWLAGMLLLALFTAGGLARYAYVLFSAHMAQHMVLGMVVPILLVGGAPITLALRTLRRPADPGVRGARDWLLLVLHSRFVRLVSHPLVALGVYVVSLYILYFSDLLSLLMRYHLGHLWMLTHFVLAGFLFYWVLIGVDPGRRVMAPPLLVLLHFAGMVFHAFLGVALMQSRTVIAADWYGRVHPAWADNLLADQHVGAGLAWGFGEIPAAVILIVLVVRWIRADEREQRRIDRAAARAEATGEEDDLARYNAFLRRVAESERR
ncbi:bifunctional copper resistance protein CopD/cytochrome c oxidase assembly protein [Dactylosporangium roseum]|uniref:Bifunctional copper resistance protein CopD/cytochrome c oxidase assembly protein n=1 Tax=Dactylosporangium roseum TaxID=47989 RepID=A0ABY5YVX6_9ACTN|nr:bifunctional copper resistance protein CopD/cytochrome c oxidase assembly protein [Dactylosporangium roseum]UWZ33895.1 bifunctional copper resistance protein CopD/cytochrome c oxidase assembly protein [Dactylosporangium roseum]